MAKLSGFPYFEIQFDKKGRLVEPAEVDTVLKHVADAPTPTDLIVISHGWNNDMARARALYKQLFKNLDKVVGDLPGDPLAGRRVSIVGILWPSKKFADRKLIPGGAAAFGGDITETDLESQLDELMDGFEADDANQRLARARDLVVHLDDSPKARRDFVKELRALIADDEVADDGDLPQVGGDFLELSGDVLLERMGTPSADEEAAGIGAGFGGAADLGVGGDADEALGAAAGLKDLATGVKAGARNFLNLLTYYKMKNRAGKIGASAVYNVLRRVRAARPDLKLHLAGHSFGARLVTAAIAGPDGDPAVPVESLTLLQAAFSHHAMAEDWDGEGHDGFYRRVLSEGRVTGPVLITHSTNDSAVGRAYPLASRLARQAASALGDANDKYGGLGRNGAQKTPEARSEKLLEVGDAYALQAGAVHNLEGSAFIASHGDVDNRHTAYALLEAIRAT